MDMPLPLKRTPEQLSALAADSPVVAEGWTWLIIHGTVCLALRHPEFTGPSRQVALRFVHDLGRGLVQWGCLTERELAMIEKTDVPET